MRYNISLSDNMYKELKIVKVNSDYCDYLRKYDDKIPYNAGKKELRPFIGVLFTIDECLYFALLSSPKPKHKTLTNILDIIKIDNGNYGVVNLNNMISLKEGTYIEFDLNKKPENKEEKLRLKLMNNQLRWLTVNKKEIYKKSKWLYNLYVNNNLSLNVKSRCCNFKLLEEKCIEYNL